MEPHFFLSPSFWKDERERQNNTRIPLCLFFIKRDIFPDIFCTPAASFSFFSLSLPNFPRSCALGHSGGDLVKKSERDRKKIQKHFTLSRPWLREKLHHIMSSNKREGEQLAEAATTQAKKAHREEEEEDVEEEETQDLVDFHEFDDANNNNTEEILEEEVYVQDVGKVSDDVKVVEAEKKSWNRKPLAKPIDNQTDSIRAFCSHSLSLSFFRMIL